MRVASEWITAVKASKFRWTLSIVSALCISGFPASGRISMQFETPLVVSGKTIAEPLRTQLLDDVGASERIDFSGKLRMLTQRISSAACNLGGDIDPEQSAAILAATTDEFGRIVNALELGDPTLNIIGQEKRRKTLVLLQELKDAWAPFEEAAKALASQPEDQAALDYIATQNLPLLEIAKRLVSELSGQYSNPVEMLQSDALIIDIAGRQRMLSQKISKEACGIASGNDVFGTVETIGNTMSLFETSLIALRDGMPAAAIEGPPTEEIRSLINTVWSNWEDSKSTLEPLLNGAEISAEDRIEITENLGLALKSMNAAVGLYTIEAKQGL